MYVGGMQAVHVSRQVVPMSGNDYLSIGGARGHTAVILGEVRMKVKMVQKCS